jgi:hypothetical protein
MDMHRAHHKSELLKLKSANRELKPRS